MNLLRELRSAKILLPERDGISSEADDMISDDVPNAQNNSTPTAIGFDTGTAINIAVSTPHLRKMNSTGTYTDFMDAAEDDQSRKTERLSKIGSPAALGVSEKSHIHAPSIRSSSSGFHDELSKMFRSPFRAPLNLSERRHRRSISAGSTDIEDVARPQDTQHSKISSKPPNKRSQKPSPFGEQLAQRCDLRGSTEFGDEIEQRKEELEESDASWNDVCRACCCHTPRQWARISIGLSGLCLFLYFFLLGLDLLGTSFKVVGGCTAGSLFGEDMNPMASLMIGIIATTLLQSSSTTTAIIVSMVSGGLNIHQAIYMVMGANVGSSVTSIIVTIAHLGDGDELERAFAGSVINFVFKIFTVVILFPVEVASQYLFKITRVMLPETLGEGESWEGPIKKIISPLVRKIIMENDDAIEGITNGTLTSCDDLYPVNCTPAGMETFVTCKKGLIGCDKHTNKCPVFFQDGASRQDDMVSGGVCLFLALFILVVCLIGLVAILRKMLLGASTRVIYKATSINPYMAMLIGCGVTVLVQSSAITTSTLVPLAGMGVLKLEQMYPLTLGADIGTTFTALMAAMVSSKVESLQVALVHLFFNLNGIVLWYPIPVLRRLPLSSARKLGRATRIWRGFPFVFILIVFFLIPLLLWGISALFEQSSKGFVALGSFFVVLLGVLIIYAAFWWRFRNGKDKCVACMASRQRKKVAFRNLPDDMDYLKVDIEYVKNEIGRLKDVAGLIEQRQGYAIPRSEELLRAKAKPTWSVFSGETDETAISLYQTCQSKRWLNLLAMPAGS